MEATLNMDYEVEEYPELEEVGSIMVHATFVRPANTDLILSRSRFSCSFAAKDFIDDVYIEEFYFFLTEAGVNGRDAFKLIQSLKHLVVEVIFSDEYQPSYALSIWLTFDVDPYLETEEAVRASLDDYERKTQSRPASKLVVESLSMRSYKRKRSSSIADKCTICLEKFKTGKIVIKLDCGHEFDDDCIFKWFKYNNACPLCRFVFQCEDDEIFQKKKLLRYTI